MPKTVTFDREKVVENVMMLFWKKGYTATSMQDLVDVTGLNRSSFYNSFGDKFSLYEEALKLYEVKQQEMIHRYMIGSSSPKEALKALFKGISSDIRAGNQNGCMISNCTSELASQDARVKEFLIANKDYVVDLFEGLVREAQKQGQIDSSRDSKSIALFLFSSLHGLRITSVIDSHLDGVVEEIMRVL